MTKQRDTDFKVVTDQRGGHVHCALFSRYHGQATWAKCGDFVVRDDELSALKLNMSGVEFEESGK